MNLINEMKVLYNKRMKALKQEIKEDSKRWKAFHDYAFKEPML